MLRGIAIAFVAGVALGAVAYLPTDAMAFGGHGGGWGMGGFHGGGGMGGFPGGMGAFAVVWAASVAAIPSALASLTVASSMVALWTVVLSAVVSSVPVSVSGAWAGATAATFGRPTGFNGFVSLQAAAAKPVSGGRAGNAANCLVRLSVRLS
jgi:hypothetical protein